MNIAAAGGSFAGASASHNAQYKLLHCRHHRGTTLSYPLLLPGLQLTSHVLAAPAAAQMISIDDLRQLAAHLTLTGALWDEKCSHAGCCQGQGWALILALTLVLKLPQPIY